MAVTFAPSRAIGSAINPPPQPISSSEIDILISFQNVYDFDRGYIRFALGYHAVQRGQIYLFLPPFISDTGKRLISSLSTVP